MIGMVSRADVLHWVREPPDGELGDAVCGVELLVAYPDQTVGEVADQMVAAEVGRVPVIARDGGRLVGLLARKDLLHVRQRVAVEEQHREGLWAPRSVERPLLPVTARSGGGPEDKALLL